MPPKDGSKLHPTNAEWSQFETLIVRASGRTGECWIMEPSPGSRYPYFQYRGEVMLAARFAYRAAPDKPPIPPDRRMLRRWCRDRNCVNPEHQVPVNDWRNAELGLSPIGANMRKDVCPNCHGEYTREKGGRRRCPECRVESRRAYEQRQKVACLGCGGPSMTGECRSCRNARLGPQRAANRAAKRAVRDARRALRRAVQAYCEKHAIAKHRKAAGGWECPDCKRERDRLRPTSRNRYALKRQLNQCYQCSKPRVPGLTRCEEHHARHMASTHASRAKQRSSPTGASL